MSTNKRLREHAPQHFNTLARSLHWLMAVMILAMLFIGAAMMTSLHHRIWLIDLHGHWVSPFYCLRWFVWSTGS